MISFLLKQKDNSKMSLLKNIIGKNEIMNKSIKYKKFFMRIQLESVPRIN